MPQEKVKRKSITPIKPDSYIAFVRSLKLVGIGLDNALVRIDRSAIATSSEEGGYGVEISADYKVLDHQAESVVVQAGFKLVFSNSSNSAEVGEIKCVFSALFSLKREANPKYLERFANVEAKLIFWPYLRHFVSDISYRMSISPILIPLTSELNSEQIEEISHKT